MNEQSIGGLQAAEVTGVPTNKQGATFDRVISATAVAACVVVVLCKLTLARLLNVNWDEFAFLDSVYDLTRGELRAVLQGSYTHLFAWLPALPGNEIDQIVVARSLMVLLLAVTAWLIWRLSLVWLHGFAALVPPFVYLSMLAVLEHGGSFRFDSMLAPLSMAALVLLLAPGRGPRRDWLAGVLLGVGGAVSVKVVLFAPLVLFVLIFRGTPVRSDRLVPWRDVAAASMRVGLTAGCVAAILIGLHWAAIAPIPVDSVTRFAGTSATKALLEQPWFPRFDYFARYIDLEPFPWLMMALGAVIAIARRRFALAALSLSLLPLLFYRNAFPYYYVVMLAPASVLAGYTVAEASKLVGSRANPVFSRSFVAALWMGLLIQAARFAIPLASDGQVVQRQLITALHQIFPTPVSYIDRCGMVPSFRKVNFFMSTWGVENYLAANRPFMPRVLATEKPAFVLSNTPALYPENTGRYGLLPEDRELLAKYYVDYWGPVRVAGSRVLIERSGASLVSVPFPDEYRLETTGSVLVNGAPHVSGDIIAVPAEGVTIAIASAADEAVEPISVTLVLASAQPPPPDALPPYLALFRGL